MQVVDSEGYLKVKLVGGPVGPFVPYTGATANVDLGTHTIIAQNATISSSGSGNTATITHSSGSGIGLSITKGGNGEGLYVNKTSGSGNAVTVIGDVQATILKITGGTSSQFLKADGSVDSTTYISGITIGTTPIASGVVGRILFEGTGNVVQQSSSLFWDATNNRLGVGTSSPLTPFDVIATDATILFRNTSSSGYAGINMLDNTNTLTGSFQIGGSGVGSGLAGNMFIGARKTNGNLLFVRGALATVSATLFGSTGNFAINTTTDAGFRLDVNGTARVQGNGTGSTQMAIIINGTSNNGGSSFLRLVNSASSVSSIVNLVTGNIDNQSPYFAIENRNNAGTINQNFRIWQSGNVTIQNGGTFTDAGFRLDVNGTARVATSILVGPSSTQGTIQTGVFRGTFFNDYANSATVFEVKTSGNVSFYNSVAIGTTAAPSASKLRVVGLPTSSAGLSAGDIWNDAGTLKIV